MHTRINLKSSTASLLAAVTVAAWATPAVAATGVGGGVSTGTPAVAPAPLNAAGEGRRLYLKLNCAGCHGNAGTGGMGPNIVGEAGEVSEVMLEGEDGGMRSYRSYVNTQDIANLKAYLRSIGTADEPKFKHWWETVPSR